MEASRPSANPSLALNLEHTLEVLTIFLREEVRRTGLNDVVVGLSGGVDSALSTYLAARALGAGHVYAVLMPYSSSTPESLKDAMAVVEDLKLPHEIFPISAPVDAFFAETERGTGAMDRMRRGNVMARMRMITLFDRSQARSALVLGTSNKTESLLGYTTLYGDNASAINPLGDLYKTQVWELARAIGVPEAIVAKPPSADLWPGQTDEAELGISYRELDEMLFLMVDERQSDEAIIQRGFPAERVRATRERIRRMQFKRRLPLIAKVSDRTINADFRYPRDWGT